MLYLKTTLDGQEPLAFEALDPEHVVLEKSAIKNNVASRRKFTSGVYLDKETGKKYTADRVVASHQLPEGDLWVKVLGESEFKKTTKEALLAFSQTEGQRREAEAENFNVDILLPSSVDGESDNIELKKHLNDQRYLSKALSDANLKGAEVYELIGAMQTIWMQLEKNVLVENYGHSSIFGPEVKEDLKTKTISQLHYSKAFSLEFKYKSHQRGNLADISIQNGVVTDNILEDRLKKEKSIEDFYYKMTETERKYFNLVAKRAIKILVNKAFIDEGQFTDQQFQNLKAFYELVSQYMGRGKYYVLKHHLQRYIDFLKSIGSGEVRYKIAKRVEAVLLGLVTIPVFALLGLAGLSLAKTVETLGLGLFKSAFALGKFSVRVVAGLSYATVNIVASPFGKDTAYLKADAHGKRDPKSSYMAKSLCAIGDFLLRCLGAFFNAGKQLKRDWELASLYYQQERYIDMAKTVIFRRPNFSGTNIRQDIDNTLNQTASRARHAYSVLKPRPKG